MPVKRYNGTAWEVIAGDGVVGAPGTNGTNGIDASPYSAGKNAVINGAFDIWQRGTSIAGNNQDTFAADRWNAFRSGVAGSTFTRQVTGDTTNLPSIQYCMRVARNSGNTSTSEIYAYNSFETSNSIPFAGKTVTYSFYARKGADYSASTLTATVWTGTGTDQNLGDTYTGVATPLTSNVTLTTSWQRFTITGTIAATATEISTGFVFTPVGTAGANDYFEVTGVQLELGSVATAFARNAGTIQGELAACQRYYFRFTGNSGDLLINAAFANTSTATAGQLQFPVTMRALPTSIDTATIRFTNFGGTGYALSSIGFNLQTTNSCQVFAASTGMTGGQVGVISGNGSGSFIGLSAEL